MSRFVITGGSRGFGRALARELVSQGNRVLITARRKEKALVAARQIAQEAKCLPNYKSGGNIIGTGCDISNANSVKNLRKTADLLMGGSDAWICNAGQSGTYVNFIDQDPEIMKEVIATNLKGTILCAQEAVKSSKSLFFVDGAGADGMATPGYAVYGATKAGLQQLWNSIKNEAESVGVYTHIVSPGMVLTPLLLEGVDIQKFAPAFNILCEHPEVPAAFLAQRIQRALSISRHTSIRYLTISTISWRIVTFPFRRNKHFDESNGLKLYSDNFQTRIIH